MKEADKKKEEKKRKKEKEKGKKEEKAVERKNKMRGRWDIQMGVLVIATRIRYLRNLAVPFPSSFPRSFPLFVRGFFLDISHNMKISYV